MTKANKPYVTERKANEDLSPTFDEEYSRINKDLAELMEVLNSGRSPKYPQQLSSLADEILNKSPLGF